VSKELCRLRHGRRNVLRFGPADEAADLNFTITLGFRGAGGLEVKPELVAGFFPRENLGGKRKSG